MSNSNFEITNFSVDPITQQITSLEINGEAIELSPEPTPVGSDIEVYGVIGGSGVPSWENIDGIAFLPSDKTQEGYALMNGSGGWNRYSAAWNEDFTKVIINGLWNYNFTLVDSSFFE